MVVLGTILGRIERRVTHILYIGHNSLAELQLRKAEVLYIQDHIFTVT